MAGFQHIPNPDGSTTVLDVPIFPTCSRGDDEYDEQWLAKNFDRMREAEEEGHLAPVHVYHHEHGQAMKPEAAGMMRPNRIGKLKWRGVDRPCIYADLILTNQYAVERLSKKQLPYRSVELSDDNEAAEWEIVSLSLLDSEPPYVEMPMTFLDDETDEEAAAVAGATNTTSTYTRVRRTAAPVLCFKRQGHSTTVFMEAGMPDPKLFQDDENKPDDKPDDKSGEGGGEDTGGGEKSGGWKSKMDALKGCKVEAEDIPDFLAALTELSDSLSGSGDDAPADDITEDDIPGEPTDNPPDVQAMQKAAAKRAEDNARVFTLETKVAGMEHEKERDALIAKTAAELADVAFSGEPTERLRKEYDEGAKEGGHKVGMFQLKHFAKIAKEGGYPSAPRSVDPESGIVSGDLPEEATKLLDGDPTHDEAVARAFAAYAPTSKHFAKSSFKSYWNANQKHFMESPTAAAK